MIELDATRAHRFLRMLGRDDLNLRVEQFEDAFGRRHRSLEDVVFIAQILDGPEEAMRILHEGHQRAQGGDSAEGLVATEPDHHRDRQRRQDFDHRVVERVRQDGIFECQHVRGIDLFELA